MKIFETKKREEKPRYNMWQILLYMISLAFKSRKSVLGLALVLLITGVSISLLELFISPVILREIENASSLSSLLLTIAFFITALIITKGLEGYVNQNTLSGRIETRIKILSLSNLKWNKTSFPNIENEAFIKKFGQVINAANSNLSATEDIWPTLISIFKNTICFLIYLTLLSSLNIFLVVVVIITSFIGYFVNKRINEWGYRHKEEEENFYQHINYAFDKSKDISLAKDIRIFNIRPFIEELYTNTLSLFDAFAKRREKVYIWTNILNVILSTLRNGVAYFYLIHVTLEGNMQASEFLLYFSAIGAFSTWVTGILANFSKLHTHSIDISRIREFLEFDEPFLLENGEPLKPDTNRPYEIKLNNVSFSYPNTQKEIISNLNLTIKPHENLAIVGLNGAGKTTLVKLISGLYDPTKGEVLLNGVNIKKYNRRDYYEHFSAVFQNFSMLETSIAENIAQTHENINDALVKECIKKADLTKKLGELKDGTLSKVGRKVYEDGLLLSGGETQRLMLARALYKNAPILLLDEPTSALDPIAESNMYNKYNEMTLNKTAVYISHRLASTRFCDRIIYLENGEIIEEGTHDNLLKINGKYAYLFDVQSKYYKVGGVSNEEN